MKLFALSVACLALLVAGGCGGGSDSSDGSSGSRTAAESTESTKASTAEKPKPTPAKPLPATDKTKPKVTVPKGISPDEFSIKELEKGTGPSAKTGDTVTIQYVVAGYGSKREIDSSWDRKPYTFTIGSGEALKGGERGVEGMKVGGRRELVIPGKLAYGPEGLAPTIGPNETLIMVVDLLAIE